MNCPDNLMILLTTHRTEVYVNTDFDKKQANNIINLYRLSQGIVELINFIDNVLHKTIRN